MFLKEPLLSIFNFNMSLLLKKILQFIPLFMAVYCFFLFLLDRAPINYHFKENVRLITGGYGHMFSRIQEINTKDSIDILILGSSHAYRGFDTRLMHFNQNTVFNLGSSSQSHHQTKQLIKTYVPKLKPKYVIYEVFPNTLTSDGVESSLDLISNADLNNHTLEMACKVRDIRTFNTLILRCFREVSGKHSELTEPIIKKEDTYISGGFVQKEFKTYIHDDDIDKKIWKTNKSQLQSFIDNIEYLKKNDIITILVFAPISQQLYQAFKNLNYYDSLYSSQEVKYINANHMNLNLNDSLHFYDLHHLNQKGVEIFNRKLSQEIKPLIK